MKPTKEQIKQVMSHMGKQSQKKHPLTSKRAKEIRAKVIHTPKT